MVEYIKKEDALSFPFANGQYDHENADEHFIFGCETYKEWLEKIPAADVVERKRGEWIPVTEWLPEEFQSVWAACKSLIDNRPNWTIEAIYDLYSNCPWGDIPMLESGKAVVYAWMDRPLPEPPKEET